MDDGHIHHPRHHEVSEHGVGTYIDRVRALLDGTVEPPAVRTLTRAPRSLPDATDEWVAQRAMAEQVVSEANAVLGAGAAAVELLDEVGGDGLAFVLRGPGGEVRVTMRAADGLAWLGCEGTLPGIGDGSELAEPMVLEDVVLHLLR